MEKFIKVIIAVLLVAANISYDFLFYKVFYLGNYYMNATIFMSVLYGVSPIILGYFTYRLIKWMMNTDFTNL